ncbi:alpha/beta hydrolase family protein [Nitrospira defluvii]|uniref:S9 family peptidase n=1 Tax=Nitrospira defluvii TaxID=330214 RepID=A0ABM8RAE4_9BACT|nr:S9 family peptidase [Nitrospira defluvii]CAE6741814.1 S9 family peptidase [Nitrospira defluvii]
MPRDPWSHAMMFLRATLFLDQPLKSKQLCTFVTILLVALIAGCKGTGQAIPEPLPADVLDEVPGRIPLNVFASLPLVRRMTLSPSGEHIASIQNTAAGKTYLVVTTYDGKDVRRLLASDNKRYSIRWCDWVNDERLLVGVGADDGWSNLRWTETRLFAMNRDGSNLKTNLIAPSRDHNFFAREYLPQLQDRVIGKLPGDNRSVLIALDLDHHTYPDVYKLDVYTGSRELIERSTYGMRYWMADRQGVVRLGTAVEGTIVHILVKPVGQDRWQTLRKYDALREPELTPLGFDEDPNILFVAQPLDGRTAVYSINLSEPHLPPILRASHATYDIEGGLIYSSWLKRVVGVHSRFDESAGLYWNPDAKELQTRVDLALPGRINDIQDSSRDGRRHIVVSSHATQPPQWYLFDEDLNRLTLMVDGYPKLVPKELVKPMPVTLKARDGTVLHGYVTRPTQERQHGPMVLFPHGGPASRDVLDFDYWTQFLVSRGWAVLQVNFRGSSGYGGEFLQAGFKRWGLDMQDDLTDAARYAIEQGIADPERICIVGGSYGGYAALMGVVKTPELFRCAVSFAGVSDLRALLTDKRQFLGYELGAERQLGAWWSDRDRLKATSPVNHADTIRTPLLIVHGAEDRVVPVEQSRAMVEALKDAGFTRLRYVELPDGDHHLSRQDDRVTFFREMERFLITHLDGAERSE